MMERLESERQAAATGAEGTGPFTAEGGYSLTGSKTWISNGGIADFYVVFAKTDPNEKAKGVSLIVVETDAAEAQARDGVRGFAGRGAAHVVVPHRAAADRAAGEAVGDGGGALAVVVVAAAALEVGRAALHVARTGLDASRVLPGAAAHRLRT